MDVRFKDLIKLFLEEPNAIIWGVLRVSPENSDIDPLFDGKLFDAPVRFLELKVHSIEADIDDDGTVGIWLNLEAKEDGKDERMDKVTQEDMEE